MMKRSELENVAFAIQQTVFPGKLWKDEENKQRFLSVAKLAVEKAHESMPKKPSGKKSWSCQYSYWVRNTRLKIALSYFEGTNWGRCQQLAELSNRVIREMNAGIFCAKTEPERIIERINKSGVKMLTTTNSIYRNIFPTN